jgi:hypothetical protein
VFFPIPFKTGIRLGWYYDLPPNLSIDSLSLRNPPVGVIPSLSSSPSLTFYIPISNP